MTTKRAISTGFILLALVLAWGAAYKGVDADAALGPVTKDNGAYMQTVTQEISFSEGGSLSLTNANGSVTVTTWHQPKVWMQATKRVRPSGVGFLARLFGGAGMSREKAAGYLDRIVIEVSKDEKRLGIKTRYPKGARGVSLSVAYEVRVPGKAALTVDTSNGRIAVTGLEGDVRLRSSNGRLECKQSRHNKVAKLVLGVV